MVFHKLNLITGVALSVYISVQLGVGFINASRIKLVCRTKVFHPGHNDDYPLSWSVAPYHPPTQKHRNDPDCPPDKESNLLCPVDLATVPDQTLPDIQSADYATQFLRSHSDGPFFLAVGFHKPHIPLKFPKQFLDLYPLDKIKEASNPTWYKVRFKT